jgi:hypothetical protein
LTYARLFFGIDFTDDSFYTAVPYRFATGARPLIDETNLAQQTSGLLLYPFVKVYLAVFGLHGIMLFARHLDFVFSCLVAMCIFFGLRSTLSDVWVRATIASTAVAFVPFGIHNLSYNRFGSGFLTAALFLGLAWLSTGNGPYLAASGVLHGLAVFAYPPLAFAVACFFVAGYVASRPPSLRALRVGFLACGPFVLATIVFFTHRGLSTTSDLLTQTRDFGGQGGGIGKVRDIAAYALAAFTLKYIVVLVLVVALALYKWKREYLFIVFLAVPLLAVPLGNLHRYPASNQFATNFALFGPLVFLLVRHQSPARRVLGLVWLPSAVAGGLTAYSSANGGLNIAIGFFPASIATAVLLILAIRSRGGLLPLVPAAALVALCVGLQYASVYRDAPIRSLDARVRGGAYAGLFTTPQKHAYLKAIERDLHVASGPACRILFYDTFPAGYLLDHGEGLTNATWMLDVPASKRVRYQELLTTYYHERQVVPDIVVRVSDVPLGNKDGLERAYSKREPLELMFTPPRYVVFKERPSYRILRRATTACANRGEA